MSSKKEKKTFICWIIFLKKLCWFLSLTFLFQVRKIVFPNEMTEIHNFGIDPITCHAWNSDRTRKLLLCKLILFLYCHCILFFYMIPKQCKFAVMWNIPSIKQSHTSEIFCKKTFLFRIFTYVVLFFFLALFSHLVSPPPAPYMWFHH